ncbi:MAG: hypothetical protein R3E84_02195 [Pseudomonadales bacterium]
MRHWLGALASALPCLGLAVVLVQVWLWPREWDNGRWVPYGIGLLLMEFLTLHSGGLFAGIALAQPRVLDRLKYFAIMLVFYAVFAWAFAAGTGSTSLLLVFAGVMTGRAVTLFLGDAADREALAKRSALGIVAFLTVTFGTIFIDVPEMGITRQLLDEVYPDRGDGGVWNRYPERAIVGAAVYFALMGLAELTVLRSRSGAAVR